MDPETKRLKRKYEQTKRLVKGLVFENAALCDKIAELQHNFLLANEENKFLYSKLDGLSSSALPPAAKSAPPSKGPATPANPRKQAAPKKPRGAAPSPVAVEGNKRGGRGKAAGGRAKKQVRPIELDATGRPVFPIIVGGLSVYSLGDVVADRPGYHNEDQIFPVGFCSCRVYGSQRDPEQQCIYTCKILDNGPRPLFEIAADNAAEGAPFVGNSAEECLAALQSKINKAIGVEVVRADGVRGPEFFGFTVPTIQNLIQSSGTRRLPGYRSLKFEVCRNGEPDEHSEAADPSLGYEPLQRSIAVARSQVGSLNLDSHDPLISDIFVGL